MSERWTIHTHDDCTEILDENGLAVAILGPSQHADAQLLHAAPELRDALRPVQHLPCLAPDVAGMGCYARKPMNGVCRACSAAARAREVLAKVTS